MAEYLLKHAKLCDVRTRALRIFDIRIVDGVVSELGDHLKEGDGAICMDLHGRFLSAGWIDAHAHLYQGKEASLGIIPDQMLGTGVTYVVDAGTAGPYNFEDYIERSVRTAKIPVKSYLNLAPEGVSKNGLELRNLDLVDIDACCETAERYKDQIIGIKLRIDPRVCEDPYRAMKLAKETAVRAKLPLIVHASRSEMPMADILSYLDRGDVFAHTFANKLPGILDEEGRIRPCVLEARKRGVQFDVSHGKSNFSYEVMRKAVSQGFYPDCISTDLHTGSQAVVRSLPVTMSKVMHCGLDFWDVLSMVTVQSASMLQLKDKTLEIAVGKKADFTVFYLEDGDFAYEDADGVKERIQTRFVPCLAVLGDEIYLADHRDLAEK